MIAEPEATPEVKSVAENLTDHVTDYVETYVKLTGLKATQKVTEVATITFTAVMLSFFTMIIMIFLGFGLAAWLGETMSQKESYFTVTFVYLVIGFIVFLMRHRIIFPFLRNHIITKIYENRH